MRFRLPLYEPTAPPTAPTTSAPAAISSRSSSWPLIVLIQDARIKSSRNSSACTNTSKPDGFEWNIPGNFPRASSVFLPSLSSSYPLLPGRHLSVPDGPLISFPYCIPSQLCSILICWPLILRVVVPDNDDRLNVHIGCCEEPTRRVIDVLVAMKWAICWPEPLIATMWPCLSGGWKTMLGGLLADGPLLKSDESDGMT